MTEPEAVIGYEFKNPELLQCALTHNSYVNEHGGVSNERLEWLGDAVLSMIVTRFLYTEYPLATEEALTDRRKAIVSSGPLAAAVRSLGLDKHYRMGKGAASQKSSFGDKPISDIFEAVLGAIYLDGGYESAYKFVIANLPLAID